MLRHKSDTFYLVVAVAAMILAILNAYIYTETKKLFSLWLAISLLGVLVFLALVERGKVIR